MRSRLRRWRTAAACLSALLVLAPATSSAVSTATPGADAAPVSGFHAFVDGLWPEANQRGISRETLDAAFAGMTPDLSLGALIRHQPEFAKPIGAYLASQVTPGRVSAGQAMLARWHADLVEIERRYQVPRSIIVAIWGMETNYGGAAGNKDVIRSLATLAAMNYRPDLYRGELLSALAMVQAKQVGRADLRGSWAGAMGQPQFMPSSFERFAVDWDGDGRRDIWADVPDALASIANFIRAQGWRSDRPWGFEVRLPPGFEVRLPPGLDLGSSRGSYADWASRGVRRADGAPLPASGDGILFFPAGSAGPAFLVTGNFEVLKTYNFSDAYVLAVATLADRMEGGSAIQAPWPGDPSISRDDRIALQTRLVTLGYTVDNREGRISLALRDVIRSAQTRVSMVPDGNPTLGLLQALRNVVP